MEMLQRAASRSRARSQSRAPAEDTELAVGLQRLLGKLRQHQPFFTEEDVSIIPFPAEVSSNISPTASTSTSVRPSPSRVANEESQVQQADVDPVSSAALGVSLREKKPALTSSTALSRGNGDGSDAFGGHRSIDLDGPLSVTLFVTAVNLFEAKTLPKSKRVSADALKLIRHAYALVWSDPAYLYTRLDGTPYTVGGGGGKGERGNTAGLRPIAAGTSKRCNACSILSTAAAPSPNERPDRQLALLVEECVRTLLVYANTSMSLCRFICTSTRTLLLLVFVCCAARRLEEEDTGGGEQGKAQLSSCAESCSPKGICVGTRVLHAEMAELECIWGSCGIEGRVVDALRECYLIEFLLDAALPPAVCSARYDGLRIALDEKKQRIVSDFAASRTGFAQMMCMAPLRGLCGLANMSAFGDPKLRARLLNKMATEGVVERLASEVAAAMQAILSDVGVTPRSSRTLSKEPRRVSPLPPPSPLSPPPSPCRGGSPKTSRSPTRRPASPRVAAFTKDEENAVPTASCAATSESTNETTPVQAQRHFHERGSHVERIGQCVDILMLLTSPNLRPPDSNDAPSSRTSSSSATAAVRATTWASREAALHEISLYLLAICFLSKTHPRFPELSSLQLYAADCVLQLAAYSGEFYAMVVHAIDALLIMMEAVAPRLPLSRGHCFNSSSRRSPLQPASPWPATAPASEEALSRTPGRELLLRLLPGDAVGLLPLISNLLEFHIHAQANTTSIERWFAVLADRLLPEVFEAPQLTSGRRSTYDWARQQQETKQKQRSPKGGSRVPSPLPPDATSSSLLSVPAFTPPALARDLTRAEVVAVAPYFRFVCQVVQMTCWRDGAAALLHKVVLLAFHVIVAHGHRCNLIFGQACECYDATAPLLQCYSEGGSGESLRGSRVSSQERRSSGGCRRSTMLMHQRRLEAEEKPERRQKSPQQDGSAGDVEQSRLAGSEERDRQGSTQRENVEGDAEEVFISSATRKRPLALRSARRGNLVKPRLSTRLPDPQKKDAEGSDGAVTKADETDLSPFIASPSASPVFYDPHSVVSTDTEEDASDREGSPSSQRRRGSDLAAALEEAANASPPPPNPLNTRGNADDSGESPEAVTYSWSGQLTVRSLLSDATGRSGEAPQQTNEET